MNYPVHTDAITQSLCNLVESFHSLHYGSTSFELIE